MGTTPPPAPDPVQALVRITLSSPELGDVGPLSLRLGQRLLAEVLAVQAESGRAILSLAGRRLQAQLPAGARAGDVLRVVVADAQPDRLVFRVEPDTTGTPPAVSAQLGRPAAAPPAAAGAPLGTAGAAPPRLEAAALLAEFGLPDTPPLRAAVDALVERQLPLSRDALSQIRAAIAALPGDPVLHARAAVLLAEEGLPLTPRAVTLARAELPARVATPLGAVLAQVVRSLAGGAQQVDAEPASPVPTRPLAPDVADQQMDITPRAALQALAVNAPNAREVQRAIATLSQPPEAVVLAAAGELALREASDAPAAAAKALPAPTEADSRSLSPAVSSSRAFTPAAPGQPPTALTVDAPPSPVSADAPAPRAFPGPDARTLLSALAASLPEGETRQLVLQLHDRIELQQLRTAARGRSSPRPPALPSIPDRLPNDTGDPALPPLSDALGDLAEIAVRTRQGAVDPPLGGGLPASAASNPRTLDLAPPLPLVLALPLAFGGQFRTLDLIVDRDSEQGYAFGEPTADGIRARFTLDLQRLGEVGGDVRLRGPVVRCRLRASNRAAASYLDAAADRLRSRLEHAGLEVTAIECVLGPAESPAAAHVPGTLRHVAVEA
ncbi:MAG TPA: flagellar hook-length control protein FliK [Chloroflexota bacterium]|nr:flagellar hook-length control protein FliK [Chloroflexota bacterium]